MKDVWIRVGMTVKVSEKQYEELRQLALDEDSTKAYGYEVYCDLDDFPEWFEEKIEKEGKIDGDSYIPSDCWD